MSTDCHCDNIHRIWLLADHVDLSEGMVAYDRYRLTLRRLAAEYDYPLESVVGAFCALSPNNSYMTNLRATAAMLRDEPSAGYTQCRVRAKRCLNGEDFLSFTRGHKTRNFYQNIMNPRDPYPVTIDGHAYSIWYGRYHRMTEAVYAKFNYEQLANDYRWVAARVGVLPCQLQAVTWFAWKRIHRVVYQGQMSLLRLGDQWGLDLAPDDIEPFADNTGSRQRRILFSHQIVLDTIPEQMYIPGYGETGEKPNGGNGQQSPDQSQSQSEPGGPSV